MCGGRRAPAHEVEEEEDLIFVWRSCTAAVHMSSFRQSMEQHCSAPSPPSFLIFSFISLFFLDNCSQFLLSSVISALTYL